MMATADELFTERASIMVGEKKVAQLIGHQRTVTVDQVGKLRENKWQPLKKTVPCYTLYTVY